MWRDQPRPAPREHDEHDLQTLLPLLTTAQRTWLLEAVALADADHPWVARRLQAPRRRGIPGVRSGSAGALVARRPNRALADRRRPGRSTSERRARYALGVCANPPVTDFVAGGYLLVQPYHPPQGRPPSMMPADLLPSPLLTSSSCLAEILPSEWAFGTWLPAVSREERERSASAWGIPANAIDGLIAWAAERVREGRVLHDDAFADVEVAREFAATFLPRRRDVRLLGLGLRREQVAEYLRDVARRDEVAFHGCGAPNGVRDGVARGLPLETGGQDLGYEVTDVVLGQARDSWLCFPVQHQIRDELAIRPGSNGLLQSYEEAARVAEWCATNDVGCGPSVWRAWRIVEYDVAPR